MKYRYTFPLIFIFLLSKSSFSLNGLPDSIKSSNSYSTYEIVKYDVKKSLEDGLYIVKSPLHFSTEDWITTGSVASAVSLSMLLDNNIRDLVKKNRTESINNITKIGQYYGEVIPAVSLSAGIYAAGLIFKERSVSLTGRLLAESLLYAGTINIILKNLFSRSRPYNNKGNMDFWNYSFNNDYYSLPSGHTTVAFTLSTVLAERIDNIYATIGLYTLASFTAYQRIYSDNHWFSDTLLGAAIGFFISKTVVRLNQPDSFDKTDPGIMGISLMMNRGYGLNFRFGL